MYVCAHAKKVYVCMCLCIQITRMWKQFGNRKVDYENPEPFGKEANADVFVLLKLYRQVDKTSKCVFSFGGYEGEEADPVPTTAILKKISFTVNHTSEDGQTKQYEVSEDVVSALDSATRSVAEYEDTASAGQKRKRASSAGAAPQQPPSSDPPQAARRAVQTAHSAARSQRSARANRTAFDISVLFGRVQREP